MCLCARARHRADPTGRNDSTLALQGALDAAFAAHQGDHAGDTPGRGAGRPRGVLRVDLGGGLYSVSRSLHLAGWAPGRIVFAGGTLVASPTFPQEEFLINLTDISGVSFEDLTFDSAHRGGGLRLDCTKQISVSSVYFLHFATVALLGDAHPLPGGAKGPWCMGHELIVDGCWFVEEDYPVPGQNGTGTAIEMRFGDSHIRNSVIQHCKVGISDSSGGNIYEALHIWTGPNSPAEQSLCFVAPSQYHSSTHGPSGSPMRLVGCYFDKCDVLLEDPHALILTASSFYGNASVIIKPTTENATIEGLRIIDNTFRCVSAGGGAGCGTVRLDTTQGSVGAIIAGTSVAGNVFEDVAQERSTEASATVTAVASAAGGGSQFEADFSGSMVFPGLTWKDVQYSIELSGSDPSQLIPRHARVQAEVGWVRVVTDTAVSGRASISVKQ